MKTSGVAFHANRVFNVFVRTPFGIGHKASTMTDKMSFPHPRWNLIKLFKSIFGSNYCVLCGCPVVSSMNVCVCVFVGREFNSSTEELSSAIIKENTTARRQCTMPLISSHVSVWVNEFWRITGWACEPHSIILIATYFSNKEAFGACLPSHIRVCL